MFKLKAKRKLETIFLQARQKISLKYRRWQNNSFSVKKKHH